MFARCRPLLRAAVIGGGAYAAGKRRAEKSAQEAGQDTGVSDSGRPQDGNADGRRAYDLRRRRTRLPHRSARMPG
jgi:hypothetical protein